MENKINNISNELDNIVTFKLFKEENKIELVLKFIENLLIKNNIYNENIKNIEILRNELEEISKISRTKLLELINKSIIDFLKLQLAQGIKLQDCNLDNLETFKNIKIKLFDNSLFKIKLNDLIYVPFEKKIAENHNGIVIEKKQLSSSKKNIVTEKVSDELKKIFENINDINKISFDNLINKTHNYNKDIIFINIINDFIKHLNLNKLISQNEVKIINSMITYSYKYRIYIHELITIIYFINKEFNEHDLIEYYNSNILYSSAKNAFKEHIHKGFEGIKYISYNKEINEFEDISTNIIIKNNHKYTLNNHFILKIFKDILSTNFENAYFKIETKSSYISSKLLHDRIENYVSYDDIYMKIKDRVYSKMGKWKISIDNKITTKYQNNPKLDLDRIYFKIFAGKYFQNKDFVEILNLNKQEIKSFENSYENEKEFFNQIISNQKKYYREKKEDALVIQYPKSFRTYKSFNSKIDKKINRYIKLKNEVITNIISNEEKNNSINLLLRKMLYDNFNINLNRKSNNDNFYFGNTIESFFYYIGREYWYYKYKQATIEPYLLELLEKSNLDTSKNKDFLLLCAMYYELKSIDLDKKITITNTNWTRIDNSLYENKMKIINKDSKKEGNGLKIGPPRVTPKE